MSVTPNLRLWSVVSNVSSIVFELAKTDTKNKEVPSFYNFEQTVCCAVAHDGVKVVLQRLEDEINGILSRNG